MTQDEQDELLFFLQWLVAAALDDVVEVEFIPDTRVLH